MWVALVVGGGVGYLLAVSNVAQDVLSALSQLPQTQHKALIFVLVCVILAAWTLLVCWPLYLCAARERETWSEPDAFSSSSFLGNLKRRGSIGHLEFLGPALRHQLLQQTVKNLNLAHNASPSALAEAAALPAASADAATGSSPGTKRRPRRARTYSGDAFSL